MTITPDLKSFFFYKNSSIDIPMDEDGETDSLQFCSNYNWFLQPFFIGSGDPTYTLLMSSDDINFKTYKEKATDVEIINALEDDHLSGQFLKVAFKSNGSTGLCRFKIQLKRP